MKRFKEFLSEYLEEYYYTVRGLKFQVVFIFPLIFLFLLLVWLVSLFY